jgi:hypothetical protein
MSSRFPSLVIGVAAIAGVLSVLVGMFVAVAHTGTLV